MPAIHVFKRSHHLPLFIFLWVWCRLTAKATAPKRLPSQWFEVLFNEWSTAMSRRVSVFGRAVDVLLHRMHNHMFFIIFCANDWTSLHCFWDCSYFVLFCKSCQKKDWNPLIGFPGCQQQVYESVWVYCFSLIPRTVPGEHSSHRFFLVQL